MKSTGKLYWHGAGGDVLLEGDPAQSFYDEYIFFNGQRIARRSVVGPNSSLYYFFSDHLGTTRIVTNATGTVVEDSDFYPFGGERVVTDTLNNNYKFTGHERDGESGLDYMVARHYAFTLGRFLQPDLPFADQQPANPQTWNLYSYARNNPLKFVDPTGRAGCPWNPCTGTDSQGQLAARAGYGPMEIRFLPGAPYFSWSNVDTTTKTTTSEDVEEEQEQQQEGQQEGQQQPQPARRPVSARSEGNNVIIVYSDGTEEVRSGGTRSWRNNNPGNLRAGDFANEHGAIGNAGGFAVFPDEATGQAALTARLSTPPYTNLTLDEAIERYAPPNENDTRRYQGFVRQRTGLAGDVRLGTLNNNQRTALANAIRTLEGWRAGNVTIRRPER
jgi:RHS repeat-associated protein